MILADELRRLRTEAGIGLRVAAEVCRLTPAVYSDLERGRRDASPAARARIAVALGAPAGHLDAAVFACDSCKAMPCACPPAIGFACGPDGCRTVLHPGGPGEPKAICP